MRSNRSILSIKYTPSRATVGKAVGGFLRYVHYRDHEQRGEDSRGVSGLVRYVAYRDQASPQGRLFTKDRVAGDRDRRELVRFVTRSLESPQTKQASQAARVRAVYRFVLSPEDARGFDLRRLARATLDQLERDAGPGDLPPWIAAEHRNTVHPHVHIVMAARREVTPGNFRGVNVTRQRLARMKMAMNLEIERQRGERKPVRSLGSRLLETSLEPAGNRHRELARRVELEPVRARLAQHDPLRWRRPRISFRLSNGTNGLQRLFTRMARKHQLELEREAELEETRRMASRRKHDRGDEREREGYL